MKPWVSVIPPSWRRPLEDGANTSRGTRGRESESNSVPTTARWGNNPPTVCTSKGQMHLNQHVPETGLHGESPAFKWWNVGSVCGIPLKSLSLTDSKKEKETRDSCRVSVRPSPLSQCSLSSLAWRSTDLYCRGRLLMCCARHVSSVGQTCRSSSRTAYIILGKKPFFLFAYFRHVWLKK